EAFWLAIGLGLAATVVMTILIWYERTVTGMWSPDKKNYVVVNTCSFGRCRALEKGGRGA
ncbi:MAG: hypothetical protein VCA40_02620, partial [Roseibacillus sp.]